MDADAVVVEIVEPSLTPTAGFGLPTAASQGASGSGSSSHTPAAPVQSPAGSFPSGGQRLGGGDEESGGSKQTRDGYTTIS